MEVMMQDLFQPVIDFVQSKSGALLRVVLVISMAVLTSRFLLRFIERSLIDRLDAPQITVGRVLMSYLVYGVALVWSLQLLGFDPAVLLGAAGLVTVALGFASQTSVSNVISGLFLIAERPFTVGDLIRIEDVSGEVLSIDMLSVKIRTFDNLYVRMPNESMLKSKVTTLTKFPLRRIDIEVGVAYGSDLKKVKQVLMDVAGAHLKVMEDPKPVYIFRGFGDSSLNLQFSVWARREDWLELGTQIREQIVETFRRNGIDIPFPQRVLHQVPVSVAPSSELEARSETRVSVE